MSDIVFILGAGCSKECGAPLMANFLDVASDLYKFGKAKDKKLQFEKVFKAIDALQAVHSKSQLDLVNVESVFNAFEVANTIGKLPTFQTGEIPEVLASLKDVIVATLEQTVKFPYQGSHIKAPYPYDTFAELLKEIRDPPTRTVSIITFNYDIALDMALYKANIRLDYGFDSKDSSSSIPVLKLHGSLNWALRSDDDKVVIPLTLNDYLQKYSLTPFEKTGTCSIPIGSQLEEYFSKHTSIKVKAEPLIVPPSWNKTEQHKTLSQVWCRAASELGNAEYIFIIGYSLPLTDVFFRFLYALGTVGGAPLRRIEVFNPDRNQETSDRFKSMLGPGAVARFNYVPAKFSESISTIRSYFPSKS